MTSQSSLRRVLLSLMMLTLWLGPTACSEEDAPRPADDDMQAPLDMATDAALDMASPDMASADMAPDMALDVSIGPIDRLFDAVEETRQIVRTSPDHLVARADALVAARDASAIFAFVRDDIALRPQVQGTLRRTFSFGPQASMGPPRITLRSGQGTLRDKAELLAHLLERAGHAAQVVGPLKGHLGDEELLTAVRRGAPAHPFDPLVDEAQLDVLEATLSAPEVSTEGIEVVLDRSAARQALADALLDALPEEKRGQMGFELPPASLGVPVVRATLAGEDTPRLLAPFAASATPQGITNIDAAALAPLPPPHSPEVRLEIEWRTSGPGAKWEEALTGSWRLDQVLGRQLLLRFMPDGDTVNLLGTPLDAIRLLTPVVTVEAPGLERDQALALTRFGKTTTPRGELVREEDGEVIVGDWVAYQGTETGPLERVVALEAEADGRRFSTVHVELQALDDQGQGVAGLRPSAFEIFEEGQPVEPFELVRDEQPASKVLILTDLSGSVPAQFKGGDMVPFLRSLAASTQQLYDKPVGFLTQELSWRGGLSGELEFLTSPDDVAAQAQSVYDGVPGPAASDVVPALRHAAMLDDITAVVVITDYEDPSLTSDMLTAEDRLDISQGAPLVLVEIPGANTPVSTAIEAAAPPGSARVGAVNADDIRPPLLALLSGEVTSNYELRYRAPREGPETRQVEVRTSDGRLVATTSYEVPPAEEQLLAESLVGLRMRLRVGDQVVQRTLIEPPEGRGAAEADADRARDMMLGSLRLSVEAGAPTTAAWFDDHMAMTATQRAFYRAGYQRDVEAFVAAIDEGFQELPPVLFTAHPPLPIDGAGGEPSWASGPRVTMLQRFAIMGDDQRVVRRFDILPTARYVTLPASDDAAGSPSAFEQTLRRTALLAIAEAEHFEQSTYGSLGADAALVSVAPGVTFDRGSFPALGEEQARWWERRLEDYRDGWFKLLPADGQPGPFWIVHHSSGEVYGMLPDGTGGGSAEDRAFYERIRQIIATTDSLARFGSAVGIAGRAGLSYQVLLQYSRTLVRLYAAVSIAIHNLDASMLARHVRVALASFVCNFFKTVLLKDVGAKIKLLRLVLLQIMALLGVENPIACGGSPV